MLRGEEVLAFPSSFMRKTNRTPPPRAVGLDLPEASRRLHVAFSPPFLDISRKDRRAKLLLTLPKGPGVDSVVLGIDAYLLDAPVHPEGHYGWWLFDIAPDREYLFDLSFQGDTLVVASPDMQALAKAGYTGVVGGIINNDLEYCLGRAGVVPFADGLVSISQQSMYNLSPTWIWVYGIPLLMFISILTIYGVCLFVATINMFFRDLGNLVIILLNLLFYATPIMYSIDKMPENFRDFLVFNPISPLFISWRNILFLNKIDIQSIYMSILYACRDAPFAHTCATGARKTAFLLT